MLTIDPKDNTIFETIVNIFRPRAASVVFFAMTRDVKSTACQLKYQSQIDI